MNTSLQKYQTTDNLKDKAIEILSGLDITESSRLDYRSRIGLFLDFIRNNGFDANSFIEFKRNLAKRNDYSVSTKSKHLAVARILLKELARRQIIPMDITNNVKSFQQDGKHKRFGLTQEEVSILLSKLAGMPVNAKNARLKAMLSLLIYQGLRQIEIIRLDVGDLNFKQRVAFVRGKGREDREGIDLHPQAVETLRSYIDICNIKSGPLFYSLSNHGRNQRLTTKSIRVLVTDFLKEAGIENSTHGFRHYFTTKLIEEFSNDLFTVAKFTRHKSIETLQIYNDNISRKNSLPKYYKAFEMEEKSNG
jgi:integrase/recombinase XerC